MKSLWNKKVFTSSGTWVCPAGVTWVIVYAAGGGGGGTSGGGRNNSAAGGGYGGCGGGGNALMPVPIQVVPGTSYTITVGAGGAGGASQSPVPDGNTKPNPGSNGSDTSFGALQTWIGALGGRDQPYTGTNSVRSDGMYMRSLQSTATWAPFGGYGGGMAVGTTATAGIPGHRNWMNSTGNNGTASGTFVNNGGAGGGGMDGIEYPGINGAGGTGGNNNGWNPNTNVGGSPAANSAAGGGGGGGASSAGGSEGATGGTGGSGLLVVTWVE